LELQRVRQALDSYVHLSTFPVAVKMANSMSEIPEKGKSEE